MNCRLLSRERLLSLFRILERRGGAVTLRELARSHGVPRWEIEAAARRGFVQIDQRKPRTGRPSWVVTRSKLDVSETETAKLPPPRRSLPRPIRHQIWTFAVHATGIESHAGKVGGFQVRPRYKAWMLSHPGAKSKAGARASSSRMRRKRDTVAAMQWTFATSNGEVPAHESAPESATAIWLRLKALGSWRATDGWKPPRRELEGLEYFASHAEAPMRGEKVVTVL